MSFDLENHFNEQEFIMQTGHQISKDLAGLVADSPAWEINFDRDALPQFTVQLQLILRNFTGQELHQFVYRVDLKENDFIRGVDASDNFELLSILIIKREAQKVYLRRQFS